MTFVNFTFSSCTGPLKSHLIRDNGNNGEERKEKRKQASRAASNMSLTSRHQDGHLRESLEQTYPTCGKALGIMSKPTAISTDLGWHLQGPCWAQQERCTGVCACYAIDWFLSCTTRTEPCMQAIRSSVLGKRCTLDGRHREGCRRGLPLTHRSMPSKPFVSRMYPTPSAPGRGHLCRAVEGEGHIGGTP